MSSEISQYINLPSLYVNGLNLSHTSATSFTVSAGQCRDSTNSFDIVLSSSILVNTAAKGVNGLDTGSLAASTMYYVFVIYDPGLNVAPAILFSLSATNPYMPTNYSYFRKVGIVSTASDSTLLGFIRSSTNSNVVFHQWENPVSVLSNGASTTFAGVDLSAAVPPEASVVYLNAFYTPETTSSKAALRTPGFSSDISTSTILFKENVAAVGIQNNMIRMIQSSNSSAGFVEYIVTSGDTLSLYVAGFEDNL